ncbi:MAG: DUF4159 domain-containing protein [Mangrovicoccus sp.]|nr:DUF4159 domain-containing protein [Mangrovicoccus sp.]
MLSLGPLGFTAPGLLLALLALPILWFLLRAVPPAPIRRRFPGVALLLGLRDDESQSDKTPWWLLLLRCLAIAAVILGLAGPVLNPREETGGSGPLLILADGSWADARDWGTRRDWIEASVTEAGRAGRPVAVVLATDLPPEELPFQAADAWLTRLGALQPNPWQPGDEFESWAAGLEGGFDTLWLSDGVDYPARAPVLAALSQRGAVEIIESAHPIFALRPARFEEGEIRLSALRARAGPAGLVTLVARGLDPAGNERELARIQSQFLPSQTELEFALSLPPELRNRLTRFELSGLRSAAAVSLADDGLRRREIALLAGRDDREGLELLSPLHYLENALAPSADLISGDVLEVLQANPDVIIFADLVRVTDEETAALLEWIETGGLLLRFAGPRMAASDLSRASEDPLMPVRLRAGGRSVGGAMSWGAPKRLSPFSETSPFFGLDLPQDVVVSAQVLAQPGPDLADRSIAALSDGTPLVTRKSHGAGQIILFHVTANAEWSSLPLSGLFVQMLERLAVSSAMAQPEAAALEGTMWQAEKLLDAFGALQEAGNLRGVTGEALAGEALGPEMPPGLYAGAERRLARNVMGAESVLAPALWPEGTVLRGLGLHQETHFKGALLSLALVLLALDIIASLLLSGRLGRMPWKQAVTGPLAAVFLLPVGPLEAQESDARAEAFALQATSEVTLAYVTTGDARVDQVSEAGLRGLSSVLFQRTSIEPADPTAVDLERDEIAFFPFLYWAISPDQPIPSDLAYAKLNRYLRSGGMILFDTRDGDTARFGGSSPNGRMLRQLARPLDIPPLEPVPEDHVLTRAFYLIQDFPGRHSSREIWVEAAPADAERAEGMPFRNLNDGVTPVVIGGNDWAGAWAVDRRGGPMLPVGRGFAGDRQREIAYRFGVNLIMHVLTGNYKSDQVHVPALLDRLGQ